jgi:hypothetical protein
MRITIFCLLLAFICGCQDNSNVPTSSASQNRFREGTYSGRYIFTSDGSADTGTAEITFKDMAFECRPLNTHFLLYGSGSYHIDSNVIYIRDELMRPAIIDGLMVMFGPFTYEAAGNRLILVQEHQIGTPPNVRSITKRFELSRRF